MTADWVRSATTGRTAPDRPLGGAQRWEAELEGRSRAARFSAARPDLVPVLVDLMTRWWPWIPTDVEEAEDVEGIHDRGLITDHLYVATLRGMYHLRGWSGWHH